MSGSPVRFAILGFGHHALRRLLPAFQRSDKAVVSGLWRRDLAVGQENCREHGIAHCFRSREELCSSADVDAVFITSPDAMHRDDALLAIAGGKAVLCEKPLAMNAEEASEIAAAAQSAGVLFGVGQNFRYNRSVDFLRDQIAAGAIGAPQLAHAEYVYPAAKAPRRWIADGSLACGGPIADVGVHCIDTLRYVLQREVTSVSTVASVDAASHGLDAVASLQLEMAGGVHATVGVSARGLYRTLVEVAGNDGVLIAENGLTVDRPVEVVLRQAGSVIDTATLDNGDGYVRMIDSFADALRGKGTFAASLEDGVGNMRILDAAYRSWRSGRREPV
jgi:1,5-anhydro-D-fructose reductase (1,5-anhydro-D-mannitol-forming)